MIPYDELQRALARWKARHSGAPEAEEQQAVPEEQVQGDADLTPGPKIAAAVVAVVSYETPDATGEIDLVDAEVDSDSETTEA